MCKNTIYNDALTWFFSPVVVPALTVTECNFLNLWIVGTEKSPAFPWLSYVYGLKLKLASVPSLGLSEYFFWVCKREAKIIIFILENPHNSLHVCSIKIRRGWSLTWLNFFVTPYEYEYVTGRFSLTRYWTHLTVCALVAKLF